MRKGLTAPCNCKQGPTDDSRSRVSHLPRFDFRNSTLRHRYDSVKYVVKRPGSVLGALGSPTPPGPLL